MQAMTRFVFTVLTFLWVRLSFSQETIAIGFWNVENLYDTIDDPLKNDNEFTPLGSHKWNSERYQAKIDHLAEVLNLMASDQTKEGLAIIGLCEVENKTVLQDLLNSRVLKSKPYDFVLIEGPDARGIDPALIYNSDHFKPLKIFSFTVPMLVDTSHQTRNILVVKGNFQGEDLVVLINHWPSRRGGEMNSRPNRISAARKVKEICDSIQIAEPHSKIIIMGDFNDDPIDKSLEELTKSGNFYNPMEEPFKKGIGTLAWKDSWNLFDQILISNSLKKQDEKNWHYSDVKIYNKTFLRVASGNFKGYPYRTYNGSIYAGGYSDHFPVYLLFERTGK